MRRFGCSHKWTPRAVYHACGWDWYTRVLQVCTVCGKPRTVRIDGRWTLEDVTVVTDASLKELTAVQHSRSGEAA